MQDFVQLFQYATTKKTIKYLSYQEAVMTKQDNTKASNRVRTIRKLEKAATKLLPTRSRPLISTATTFTFRNNINRSIEKIFISSLSKEQRTLRLQSENDDRFDFHPPKRN